MLPLTARCVIDMGSVRYSSRNESSRLMTVTVDLTTDRTSEAEVVFADPNFEITDRHLDDTGLPRLTARIWLGYGEDLGEPHFKGVLAGHEHDGERAVFRFHDQGAKLKTDKKLRYHNGKSDFDIIRSIAGEYEMNFVVLEGAQDGEAHESLIQRGVNDWDFIRTIARRYGIRLWIEGDTIFAQGAGKHGTSAQVITYRKDFLLVRPVSLSYKLPENRRGRHQSVKFHVRGAGGQRVTGEDVSDERGRKHQSAGEDLPHHTRGEAARRARGKRLHVKESAFEHRIRLLDASASRFRLRSVITLAGCGDFYGGDYVIHALRKEWRRGALMDELTLRRDLGKAKPRPAPRVRGRR